MCQGTCHVTCHVTSCTKPQGITGPWSQGPTRDVAGAQPSGFADEGGEGGRCQGQATGAGLSAIAQPLSSALGPLEAVGSGSTARHGRCVHQPVTVVCVVRMAAELVLGCSLCVHFVWP